MPTKKNTKDPYKVATGHLLRLWREKNGWSQGDLHDLAEAYELPIYDSQISHFERAVVEPKSACFVALGKMMKIIDEGDFSKIKDQKLKDALKGSEAIFHSDGKIYSGSYWFACFVGEIKPPKQYRLMDDDRAKDLSKSYRVAFDKKWENAKDKRAAKRDAWGNIETALKKFDWAEKLKLKIERVVLMDMDDFTADEINRMQGARGTDLLMKTIQSPILKKVDIERIELTEAEQKQQQYVKNLKF